MFGSMFRRVLPSYSHFSAIVGNRYFSRTLGLSSDEILKGTLFPHDPSGFSQQSRLEGYGWHELGYIIELRRSSFKKSLHDDLIFRLVLPKGNYFLKGYDAESLKEFHREDHVHEAAVLFGLSRFILQKENFTYGVFNFVIYPFLTQFGEGSLLLKDRALLEKVSTAELIHLYLFCWVLQLTDLCKSNNILLLDDASIFITDLENPTTRISNKTGYQRTNNNASSAFNFFLQCLLAKQGITSNKKEDLNAIAYLPIPDSVVEGANKLLLSCSDSVDYESRVLRASLRYLINTAIHGSRTLDAFLLQDKMLKLDESLSHDDMVESSRPLFCA